MFLYFHSFILCNGSFSSIIFQEFKSELYFISTVMDQSAPSHYFSIDDTLILFPDEVFELCQHVNFKDCLRMREMQLRATCHAIAWLAVIDKVVKCSFVKREPSGGWHVRESEIAHA